MALDGVFLKTAVTSSNSRMYIMPCCNEHAGACGLIVSGTIFSAYIITQCCPVFSHNSSFSASGFTTSHSHVEL